jgi:hypothetical protein
LRGFLNDDVFNSSFTDDERDFILKSTVTSQECRFFSQDRPGGLSSEDYLFVLSLDEIEQYFSMNNTVSSTGSGFIVYVSSDNRSSVQYAPSLSLNSDRGQVAVSEFANIDLALIGSVDNINYCQTLIREGIQYVPGSTSLRVSNARNTTNFDDIKHSWVRVDVPALETTETTIQPWSLSNFSLTAPATTFTSTNRLGSIVASITNIELAVPFNNVNYSLLVDVPNSGNANTYWSPATVTSPNATPAMWVDIAPRYIEVEVTAAPSVANNIGSGESVPANGDTGANANAQEGSGFFATLGDFELELDINGEAIHPASFQERSGDTLFCSDNQAFICTHCYRIGKEIMRDRVIRWRCPDCDR